MRFKMRPIETQIILFVSEKARFTVQNVDKFRKGMITDFFNTARAQQRESERPNPSFPFT